MKGNGGGAKTYNYKTTPDGLTDVRLTNSGSSTTSYKGSDFPSLKGASVFDDDSYYNMLEVKGSKDITIEGVGTDAEKNTFVRLHGLKRSIYLVRKYTDIAIAALEKEVSRPLAAQAADDLLNISGISASFVLFPHNDGVAISARSIGDANVQMILEPLGGGGNTATAGAQMKDCTLEDAVARLKASVDQFYED
jgi:c-di-AMP phosphodiesterase-like protein